MKESRLLRILDRYVGSFLCFVFSLFRSIRPYRSDVKRVLLIELFEMGASIMIIPSIRNILRQYPDAEIYVLTTKGNFSSWDISGLINRNRIICLDGKNFVSFSLSALQALVSLRRIGIDLVIDFEKFSRVSTIFSVLAGAKRIAGFYRYEYEGLYRGSRLIDVPCSFNQNAHISQNFLALTKAALSPETTYPNIKDWISPEELSLPRFNTSPEQKRLVRQKLGLSDSDKLVLVCPDVGANLQVRNYPLNSFAFVASELLADDPDRHIAIIGVESNRPICDAFERLLCDNRVHNLCGATQSLEEVIELISISELIIGNDNGPLHFASLTDTRILGIFSTDSPFMYGPLGEAVVLYSFFHCSPCISALNHKHSRCSDNRCIQVIPPEFVAEMALKLIAGDVQTRTINGELPYLLGSTGFNHTEPFVRIRERSRYQDQHRTAIEPRDSSTQA